MSKIMEIAKTVQMLGSERFVYIRGYVRKVKVLHKTKKGEWVVLDGDKREVVFDDCFYHRIGDGPLIARDMEFNRRYPNHPVEVEQLPSL